MCVKSIGQGILRPGFPFLSFQPPGPWAVVPLWAQGSASQKGAQGSVLRMCKNPLLFAVLLSDLTSPVCLSVSLSLPLSFLLGA